MIDVKLIREDGAKVKKILQDRGVVVNVDRILELDKKIREFLQKGDNLRAERNKLTVQDITRGKALKEELRVFEDELRKAKEEFDGLFSLIPNFPLEGVPIGKDENANLLIREGGKKPNFKFKPVDYLTLGEKLGIIDVPRAAKVSGSRFGYLKAQAARLEMALVQLAFEVLSKEGFVPIIPPVMIKPEMMKGMGYIDTQVDSAERYYLEKEKLFLVGTSEQSVGPMHADEIFSFQDLPKRYVAFSSCFREEAGSYGKDTKGILRVHQFDKVEMFVYSKPEKSRQEHENLIVLQEKIMKLIKLPYRLVHLSTGDMVRPSASTFDIETWMPGQGQYRETHSASNCTDFQSRRLKIRYRDDKGIVHLVHTLNGTAFAIGRIIVAIIENYQQANGTIKVPAVLQKYTGFKVIK